MIKLLIGSSVAIVALYLLIPSSKDAEDSETSEWTDVTDPYAAGRQTVSTVSIQSVTPATHVQKLTPGDLSLVRESIIIDPETDLVSGGDIGSMFENSMFDKGWSFMGVDETEMTKAPPAGSSVQIDSTVSTDTIDYFRSVGQTISFAPESDPIPEQSEVDEYLAESGSYQQLTPPDDLSLIGERMRSMFDEGKFSSFMHP